MAVIHFFCLYVLLDTEMDGIQNSMQKKAAELERMAEVLVTGEQLR